MDQWIRDLVAKAVGPVRDIAEAARQRITWIWTTIGLVFGQVRSRWGTYRTLALAFVRGTWSFAGETFSTLWWLDQIKLPRWASQVLNSSTRWARDYANALDKRMRGVVTTLERWAKDRVDWLWREVKAARRWAANEISQLWTMAKWTHRRVRGLLSDPRVLADWLAGAITGAIGRYVHRNADKLGSWLLRRSPGATLWFAQQVEKVIGRLL